MSTDNHRRHSRAICFLLFPSRGWHNMWTAPNTRTILNNFGIINLFGCVNTRKEMQISPVFGIGRLMVVSGEKEKGNVWARLMIGQMGEYINVDQFSSESWENVTQNCWKFYPSEIQKHCHILSPPLRYLYYIWYYLLIHSILERGDNVNLF